MREAERMRIVLLHGYDSSAFAVASLAAELTVLNDCDVDCPQGPLAVAGGDFCWWADDDGITAARSELIERVDLVNAVLVGFSQGGALAIATAVHPDSPVRGVVCASGFLAPGFELRRNMAPLLLLHGDDDDVVDCIYSETIERSASKLGIDVVRQTYSGKHDLPPDAADRITAWIRTRFH